MIILFTWLFYLYYISYGQSGILYSPESITITETNIHTEVSVCVEFDSRRSGFRNQEFLEHVVVNS